MRAVGKKKARVYNMHYTKFLKKEISLKNYIVVYAYADRIKGEEVEAIFEDLLSKRIRRFCL